MRTDPIYRIQREDNNTPTCVINNYAAPPIPPRPSYNTNAANDDRLVHATARPVYEFPFGNIFSKRLLIGILVVNALLVTNHGMHDKRIFANKLHSKIEHIVSKDFTDNAFRLVSNATDYVTTYIDKSTTWFDYNKKYHKKKRY